MIIGYLLVGAVAGLLASLVTLFLGETFWLALGIYALVGAAVTILLPLAQMAITSLARSVRGPSATSRWSANEDPRSSDAPDVPQSSQLKAPMRILAVDDDPFILDLVPMLCAKAGFFDVVLAESGEKALDLLTRSGKGFECLLLDISMPGMDGIELCREVRKIPQYRGTPILMLSAMRDIQHMGDAYRAGATDYITKPFDIEELGTQLRLAQDAIQSGHDAGTLRQEDRQRGQRPGGLRLQAVGSLVDYRALSSFLTRLPRKKVDEIKIFAISIDDVEELQGQASPEEFAARLQEIAAAAARCFDGDRTVMAYDENAALLIAAGSANPPSAIALESDIARRLGCGLSEHGPDLDVSVGGPVPLQGARTERAEIATARALAFAKNRSLDKHGRKVAGLFSP
ncbi:response regulator [Roseovarius sp. S1116L3]|uniref:response regulator n=1 Tax=Roseovarius roseus TaxID=3342636 RepID=UPI00372CD312